ncbi:MAG: 16S rRNA (uracil(1498)-N(3))-methyltransferase, partial [Syntrophomonadaceae bacterium]
MHRFFVDPQDIINQQVHFSQSESRHIERVMRLRSGDTVVVFDGSGWEYQVELLEKASSALVGQIISREYQDRESPFKLALVQGIAKGEKMDTIIQKAVEAGIDSIYPLLTERTVVQLAGQKSQQKQERWQTISRQACKQCRRNRVPFVSPPLEFASFLEQHQGQPILMLYESEQECTLRQVLKKDLLARQIQPWYLMVGPEGGFSEAEAAMARQKGAILVSLGPRI